MVTWNISNEAINIVGKDKYLHLWSDSERHMCSVNAYAGQRSVPELPFNLPLIISTIFFGSMVGNEQA
jgi:hypothetical protein